MGKWCSKLLTWSQHGWTRGGEVGCGLTGRTNLQHTEPVMAVWVWCWEKTWKMEVSTQNILKEHRCKSGNWEYKVAWIKITWSIVWSSSEKSHGGFPQWQSSSGTFLFGVRLIELYPVIWKPRQCHLRDPMFQTENYHLHYIVRASRHSGLLIWAWFLSMSMNFSF